MSGWIDAKVDSTVLVMCTVMLFIFIGEEVCRPVVAYMIEQCIADDERMGRCTGRELFFRRAMLTHL